MSISFFLFVFSQQAFADVELWNIHALNVEYETMPGSVSCTTSTSRCKHSESDLLIGFEEHCFFVSKTSVVCCTAIPL